MLDSIRHIARQLAEMDESYIRYKILLNVFCRELDSREIRIIRDEVAESMLVRTLLAEQQSDGRIDLPPHTRWRGAHWVLYLLADLGHASDAKNLGPLAEQIYTWLLSPDRTEPVGGSTEGHALYYLHFLVLTDDRVHQLATRLADWAQRWKPGKTPASYAQGLAALHGLSMHVRCSGDTSYQSTVDQLAKTFLDLALYKRPDTDQAISGDFTSLHYPCYEHGDLLFALKVLAEAGWATDLSCRPAVELLKSKQLADGTFPAERKYYRVGRSEKEGGSLVNWGGTNKTRANLFVTIDALSVLRATGERF